MQTEQFLVIDEGGRHTIHAVISGDTVRIAPDELGWELKDEGLCRGGTCVPVRGHDLLVTEHGVDLQRLAALLRRPLALDGGERVAVLGTAARERAASLASLRAPDFELPDVDGKLHRLSDYRGKKVLLVAYASW